LSEIISVIVCEPATDLEAMAADLELKAVQTLVVPDAADRPHAAPHFAALWHRLGWTVRATALVLLGTTTEGYVTSSVFLPLQREGGSEIAYYSFTGAARIDLEKVLRFALGASTSTTILVLSESTYSLASDTTGPLDKYARFPIAEPVGIEAFLLAHDRGELREAVIFQVELSPPV
jgi:hypothetical protein